MLYSKEAAQRRRSRNDTQGRDFKCLHCEKTYLSSIALRNHMKSKHPELLDFAPRGRGRPRKNAFLGPCVAYDKHFAAFLESTSRSVTQEFDFLQAFKEDREEFRVKYSGKVLGIEWDSNQVNETCDDLFFRYLEMVHFKVSRDFFRSMVTIVSFFREFLNIRNERTQGGYYTQCERAESVPSFANDYLVDYMENNNFFGFDFKDILEVIQHLCLWLLENEHTKQRLIPIV